MATMNAEEKTRHLRTELTAARAQREKIRATRDVLKIKLEGCEHQRECLARSHRDLWRRHVYPHHDTALPPEDLVEHIAFKRGTTVDAGIGLLHDGYVAVQQIKQVLDRLGGAPPGRILDFGCGCGRLTRYMGLLGEEGVRVEGCDVDAPAIAWAERHLPNSGRFFVSPDRPPLPVPEGGGFDLIVALSVFTHLPEDMQDLWLAELMNWVRPGGRLLATIHGPYFYRFVPEEKRTDFPSRGFLHCDLGRTPGLPDYYLTAFHTGDYVRDRWTRYGELETIAPMAVQLQDAVVLRRPQ